MQLMNGKGSGWVFFVNLPELTPKFVNKKIPHCFLYKNLINLLFILKFPGYYNSTLHLVKRQKCPNDVNVFQSDWVNPRFPWTNKGRS